MEDYSDLCLGCMQRTLGEDGVCSNCGFDENAYDNKNVLKLGTILNNKYIVGKTIGKGGFGITYIGYDMTLQIKVAIKELFPSGTAQRGEHDTVIIREKEDIDEFEKMKTDFLSEARVLAKFDEQPGIVSVKDVFMSNNTAYIVMEFLDGRSLFNIVKNDGPMEYEKVFEIFRPVIKSLGNIHDKGLIHRDISPDNIVLTENNQVKLIDFGTVIPAGCKSDVRVFKKGFTPMEQYEGRDCGAVTDVYALCSTIYYVLTGKILQASPDRAKEDKVVPIEQLVNGIPKIEAAAIMQGLAMNPDERICSARDMYYYMYIYAKDEAATPDKMKTMLSSREIADYIKDEKKSLGYRKKTIIVTAIIVIIITIIGLLTIYKSVLTKTQAELPQKSSEVENSINSITENKETKAQKLTESEQKEQLRNIINTKRESITSEKIYSDDKAELFAADFAADLAQKNENENLNDFCNKEITLLKDKYGIYDIAWMVALENNGVLPDYVYNDLVGNESNKKAFANEDYKGCGIAVSEEKKGQNYWVVILTK